MDCELTAVGDGGAPKVSSVGKRGNLLVYFTWLGGDGWAIGCHAVFDEGLVDQLDALCVRRIVRRNREINAHRPVNLNIDESGGNNLPAEVDNSIWHRKFIVETSLRIDDHTSARIDPEILLNQLSIVGEPAVCEFDEHLGSSGFVVCGELGSGGRLDNHDLLYRWRGARLHRASDMLLCDESGDRWGVHD